LEHCGIAAVNSGLVTAEETLVMLKSESERILRRCIEETKATFSEEQIKCIALAIIEITDQMIQEALSVYKARSNR
jgi:hypothetical protein